MRETTENRPNGTMDGIDLIDWGAFDAEMAKLTRRGRLPYVRAWRWLRDSLVGLVCRARGHRWQGGEYWTDCGKEYWAVCRRCGEDRST